jgi:hypothetical protein
VDLLLAEAEAPDPSAEMRAELARVEAEARRLAEALARGGDLEVLLTTLRAREDRAKALRAELAAVVEVRGVAGRGREELLQEARSRAAELRAILGRDLEGAREVVQVLFGKAPLGMAWPIVRPPLPPPLQLPPASRKQTSTLMPLEMLLFRVLRSNMPVAEAPDTLGFTSKPNDASREAVTEPPDVLARLSMVKVQSVQLVVPLPPLRLDRRKVAAPSRPGCCTSLA